MLARTVRAMGFGTNVIPLKDLFDTDVVRLVAGRDVVVGCMDSVEGRHLLNRLATFYLLPYFDVAVPLEADGTGNVENRADRAADTTVARDGGQVTGLTHLSGTCAWRRQSIMNPAGRAMR